MSFDRLAGFYRYLEYMSFWTLLQKGRRHLFGLVLPYKAKILVIGEGDGRFVAYAHKLRPDLDWIIIESSGKMIAEAKKRIQSRKISYLQADFLNFEDRDGTCFDAVFCPYFFSCLAQENFEKAMFSISKILKSGGILRMVDFRDPRSMDGIGQFLQSCVLKVLYLFFRKTAQLEANRLPKFDMLYEASFTLSKIPNDEYPAPFLIISTWTKK